MKSNFLAITAVLLLFSLRLPGAQPQTHTVTGTRWAINVTPSGNKVEFCEENLAYKSTPSSPPYRKALYTMQYKAELKFEISQVSGEDILPGSVTIDGAPGYSASKTVKFPANMSTMVQGGFITIRAKVRGVDAEGKETLTDVVDSTGVTIEFHKPLQVDLQYSGNRRNVRLITQKATPYFRWLPEGCHMIDYHRENWPDVTVQMKSTGPIAIDKATTWSEKTDENGILSLAVSAPRNEDADNDGWVNSSFLVVAEKENTRLGCSLPLSIRYAIVWSAANCRLAMPDGLGGFELGEPLWAGFPLQKGYTIQIGGRTVPVDSHVTVEFCDGHQVTLEASAYLGYQASVGDGEVSSKPYLLYLDLKDLPFKIQNDPRRYGRIVVSKILGKLTNTLAGVPTGVDWVAPSPGGKLEKWILETSEPYQKPEQTRAPAAGPSGTATTGMVSVGINFFSDGSTWIENNGGIASVSCGDLSVPVFAGAGRLFSSGTQGQTASDPGAISTTFIAPAPDEPAFTPTQGATGVSPYPSFSISGVDPEKLVWESLVVRLDGQAVTNHFVPGGTVLSGSVPAMYPLADGAHTLALECRGKNGASLLREARFTVAGLPGVPSYLGAIASGSANSIYWGGVPGAAGYKVWRSSAAGGAKTLLKAPRQPACVDAAPLPAGYYWVEALASSGSSAGLQGPTLVDRTANTLTPPASAISGFAAAPVDRGIQIDFDPGPEGETLWLVERSTNPTGPFVRLAPEEDTIAPGWIDPTASLSVEQYYRLVARDLAGAESTSDAVVVAASPVPVSPPGEPSVTHDNGHPRLRWNPIADVRATSLRVYRDDGSGAALVASLPAGSADFLDENAPTDRICRYFVKAGNAAGEGPASPVIGYAEHPRPTEPSIINLIAPAAPFPEAGGEAVIEARRTGNLGEPAFLQVSAFTGSEGDGSPSPSTLAFAKGQSSALVHIPITADSIWEYDEYYWLRAVGTIGSAKLGATTIAPFIIRDKNDVFAMTSDWMNLVETDGVCHLSIDRIWPSARSVSVAVTLDPAGTTAVAGMDYASTFPIRVNFGPNEATKIVDIVLANDAVKDGVKQMAFVLSDSQGGASIGTPNTTLLRIRDDETLTGQLKPDAEGSVIVLPAGSTSASIPFSRINGADGPISAFVEPSGGTLRWGSINITNGMLKLADGVTSGTINLTLASEGVESRIGRFCELNIANTDYPGESHSVVLVFPPADTAGTGIADWLTAHGVDRNALAADSDHDGRSNLVEYAQGTDPSLPDQPGTYQLESASDGSITFNTRVAATPDVVVLAEVSDTLNWTGARLVGGRWTWNEEAEAFDVSFPIAPASESPRKVFVRLRVIQPYPASN